MKKIQLLFIALFVAFLALSCTKENPQSQQYTITFDSRGGSSVASQTVAPDSKMQEPDVPVYEGHNFNGWITEDYEEWDFDEDVVASDMTLYANWLDEAPSTVTLMFYSAGGGDRDFKQVWNMRNCVSSGRNESVNMTFQYKFSKTQQEDEDIYANYHGVLRMDLVDADGMKGCTVYERSDKCMPANLKDLPLKQYSDRADFDMGDPKEIAEFIKWSAKQHPADKYVLIMADHGGGWNIGSDGGAEKDVDTKGIIYDDNLSGKCITAKNIADGVTMSGVNIEVLYFDACLMTAWENLYELKNAPVKYLLSSMETSYGGNYKTLLEQVKMTPDDMYSSFKRYMDLLLAYYEKSWWAYVDMSMVDLPALNSTMTPVLKKINDTYRKDLADTNLYVSSSAAATFRRGLMSHWSYVTVTEDVAERIEEIYPTTVKKNKAGQYRAEAKYLLLYRKNHQDEWNKLPSTTQDYLVDRLSVISGYGVSLGDILDRYKIFYDEKPEGMPDDLYKKHKAEVGQLRDEYLSALRKVCYINCTRKVSEEQAYIEVSPSVNVLAMNEDGWKTPWEKKGGKTVYNYNGTNLANNYSLQSATDAYGKCAFSKETGWLEVLKLNPYNPSILSNDTRMTRYCKK